MVISKCASEPKGFEVQFRSITLCLGVEASMLARDPKFTIEVQHPRVVFFEMIFFRVIHFPYLRGFINLGKQSR